MRQEKGFKAQPFDRQCAFGFEKEDVLYLVLEV